MKTILKTALLAPALVLMLIAEVPPEAPLRLQLIPEAHAIFGVWRRAARRTVIVAGAATATAVTVAATEESAAAKQQAAAAQQQAAAAQKQAAAAQQPQPAAAAAPPPPPVAAGKPLPLGTVVPTLPAGCTSTPVGGINYFYCSGNFYRAVFQGNNLVYVTAQP